MKGVALGKAMKEFENFLQSHDVGIMESFHPYFQKAFWEMVANGGKRFRPSLILSVVCAKRPKKLQDSFFVALGVESLHTYSLIHDDLPSMDNADMRRSHRTLHKKYDECSAILVGDALNTYAFYLITQAHLSDKIITQITHTLSSGAIKMVLGQALDCYFENTMLPKDKLDFIHTNKTAYLIANSLEIGGIIAKMSKKEIANLRHFGILLGLYFQIRDDIIDATKDEREAGKPTHSDGGKNSYVNLLGLETAIMHKDKLYASLKGKLKKLDKDIRANLTQLLANYT